MDRGEIEQRLNELEAEKVQAIARVHALEGAVLEARYWLSKLTPEQSGVSLERNEDDHQRVPDAEAG